ncbi:MAG TPA: DUF6597 domain-containing transcriptional factor, partial [Acidimicrobiales bacterium]|nr:DUF6597 domain-containing transcriptional factor [Acidimicrobiales bacterium]
MGTGPVSTYFELAPPAALAPYVACLWVQRIAPGGAVFEQPVLPDGCIDVVAVGDDVTLAGPATRSQTLQLVPGTLTVGARFRTGAAPSLLGASAAEFRDHDLALDAVWGATGAALAARVAESDGWRARLEALVDGLLGRIGTARAIDPVGPGIAALIAAEPRR